MDVRIRSAKKVAVVELDGEINRKTIMEAECYLNAVVESGCNTIVLSLEKTSALPSTGLHFLMDARDRLQSGGKSGSHYGKMILASIPKELDILIESLGFTNTFELSRTVRNALNKEGVDERSLQEGIPGSKKFVIKHADGTEKEHSLDSGISDEDLQKLVRLCMPGKMALNVIEYFHTPGQNVARISQVAASLGENENKIRALIDKLTKRAIFKPMGADTFNFMPKPDLLQKINQFFSLYKGEQHSKLLKMVLEAGE